MYIAGKMEMHSTKEIFHERRYLKVNPTYLSNSRKMIHNLVLLVNFLTNNKVHTHTHMAIFCLKIHNLSLYQNGTHFRQKELPGELFKPLLNSPETSTLSEELILCNFCLFEYCSSWLWILAFLS